MQLYHTKVVPAAEDEMWTLPAELPDFSKARLVVISAPFESGSKEEQTLQKMMGACKVSPDEYCTIQLEPGKRMSWQMLAGAGAPDKVLMLGVVPGQLGINALFRLNYGNSFLGCTFIPSGTLEQIEQVAGMKKDLWEQGLKPCFVG
jgi:hypothetical protein